jgi:hypothetical protein
MTDSELKQLIQDVLGSHDGCCLDSDEDVLHVATALISALREKLDESR